MSLEQQANIDIRRQREEAREKRRRYQEQEYIARVRKNVENFCSKYKNDLNQIHNKGLYQYVKHDYDKILSKIRRAEKLVKDGIIFSTSIDDINEGKALSFEIKDDIHRLYSLAYQEKRRIEAQQRAERKKEQERQRQERERQKERERLEREKRLKEEEERRRKEEERIKRLEQEKRQRLEAERKALEAEKRRLEEERRRLQEEERLRKEEEERRRKEEEERIRKEEEEERLRREEEERRRLEQERKDYEDFIAETKARYEAEKKAYPAIMEKAVNQLSELEKQQGRLSLAELHERVRVLDDELVVKIADEDVRQRNVRAIYQSLKKAGFVVDNPKISGDVVILRSQKPAGQRAEFAIKADGGLTFKFDKYEGQKCKQDIDQVTALLDECYGIKLEETKTLWSNPDKIQKGQKDLPIGNNNNRYL